MKELCKNIAIVFLSCSAVFLATRVEALTRFTHYLLEEDTVATEDETDIWQSSTSALLPWVIVALDSGAGKQVGAVQSGEVFSLSSQILKEALGNVATGQEISQEFYYESLAEGTCLFFQWMGEIPLSLLGEWAGATLSPLGDGAVNALFLRGNGQGMDLYYESLGAYYQCQVLMLEESRLETVVAQVEGEGLSFGFQQEGLEEMDPLTLLWAEALRPVVYTATTAYDEGHRALLETLGFQALSHSQYSTHDGMVIRSGTDTLRMTYEGLVSYQAEQESRFTLAHSGGEIGLLEQVEGCLTFATWMMQTMETMPELSLALVEEGENGVTIGFSASLSGVPLSFGQGVRMVEFLLDGDEILEFTLHYRHYKATEERSAVLPVAQALVIMENLGFEVGELFLSYFDQGEEEIVATWVAEE